jgi:hypothetical protein
MAYLTGPRLHFAGTFITDPSTVNNFPVNFERKRYTKEDYDSWAIGYWNPYGTGVWRLVDCRVTGAVNADGSLVVGDPVLSMAVADADDRPPAKLVDLDSEQQMVSAIWGMLVRITAGGMKEAVRGNFSVASFTDLWARSLAQSPDVEHPLHLPSLMGAAWQSVLTDLEWGDLGRSAFLAELQAAAASGKLSIRFNVDGYNAGYASSNDGPRYLPNPPDFTSGRIVGTIGVAQDDEPERFTLGRQLMPTHFNKNSGLPSIFGYCSAVVNDKPAKLTIDLGNAIAFKTWRGAMVQEALEVGILEDGTNFKVLGTVTPDNDWYKATAGVCDLPADRPLTDDERKLLATNPVAVRIQSTGETLAQEPADGRHVRADQFVLRLSPGEKAEATLWATKFGQPLAGAEIGLTLDPSGLQPDGPPVGVPTDALNPGNPVITGENGSVIAAITSSDPGTPRSEDDIDGQVYGVKPNFADAGPDSFNNAFDFLSLLVWSGYKSSTPPTWDDDIEPILHQYANLYPIMRPILDMGNYDSVMRHLDSLVAAMSLPVEDPNYMPAVRDLSPAKREAILTWAKNPVRGKTPVTAEA